MEMEGLGQNIYPCPFPVSPIIQKAQTYILGAGKILRVNFDLGEKYEDEA